MIATLQYTGPHDLSPRDLLEAGWLDRESGMPAMHRERLGLHDPALNDLPPTDALVRWAQNYFRHHLTNYEAVIEHASTEHGACYLCASDDDILPWALDAMQEEEDCEDLSEEAQETWSEKWRSMHECSSIDRRARDEDREALHDAIEGMMRAMGLSEIALAHEAEILVGELGSHA